MKNLNPFLMNVRQSDSVALNDKVQKLKNGGRKIFALNAGDPNFDTPGPIVETALKSVNAGETHYADSRGIPELRNTISNNIKIDSRTKYDPGNEILVTAGAIHAYYIALQSILKNDDEILVPDPSWVTHANLVELLGGKAVRVSSFSENNFFPKIADFDKFISQKTIAIVINSPNNPTGSVAGNEYLIELAEFAEKHNLYIISDEVYERLVFDNIKHYSMAEIEGTKNRNIILKSFSKTYAMTGWRIGYLLAPENIIEQAIKASQYSITNVPPFIQRGAIEALTNPDVEAEVIAMKNEYEYRRNLVLDIFKKIPCEKVILRKPAGAFYFFIDASALNIHSINLAERILDDTGIALVPGSAYGKQGEGFLRFSISASRADIEEGTIKLISWINHQ